VTDTIGRLRARFPRVRLPGGVFGRSVVTLASGTAVAQLGLALATPVLTRLYSPADYGTLAVYASTVTVLLVIASLRYELAIPLPEDETMAGSLLGLALLLVAGMTVGLALLVWLAGDAFIAAVRVPALRPYRWLVPLGFAGAGLYQALSYWAIRRRAFGRLARTRLSQGLGQVATQLGCGFAGLGAPGLLMGDVVGRVAGGGGLGLAAVRDRPFARTTRGTLAAAAARYRRFPLLTTWSGLLNVGSLQLPSILFAAFFGAAAAGLYALSYKMLVLPTMLLGQSVAQVFLSRAAIAARDPAELRQLTERTALVLFGVGLPLFAVVALGGPQIFGTVMGQRWEQAGRYAQVLAPWFVVWLVSSPLSGLLNVREWQGSALAFSAGEFVLRLGSLMVGSRAGSPLLAVALLSASGVIVSLASIVRFMHAAHSSVLRLVGPAARLLGLTAACLLPAAAALRAGQAVLTVLAAALGVTAYYLLALRSEAAARMFRPGVPGSGASELTGDALVAAEVASSGVAS
jgi:O-antigen/teichoic acid export membrane protein